MKYGHVKYSYITLNPDDIRYTKKAGIISGVGLVYLSTASMSSTSYCYTT